VLYLSDTARAAFAEWFTQNGQIVAESSGIAAGFYAKYPGQVLRIALVLHCLWYPGDMTKPVGADTMYAAIDVIEYLRKHLVRILPRFAATGSLKEAGIEARVMRVLNKHNGEWVARRALQKGLGNSVSADELTSVLKAMEAQGRIETRTVATGARPREECRSLTMDNSNNEHMNKSEDADGGSSSASRTYVHPACGTVVVWGKRCPTCTPGGLA
jgi:hypothetical protein